MTSERGSPPTSGSSSFRDAFRIQQRVLAALIMREIHIRYARKNIGFLWVVVEPIMFAFAVIALRAAIPYGESGHGIGVVPFLLTGYLPFMLFRNLWSAAMRCVRDNSNVLYHRQVGLLDIYAARFALELAGVVTAIVASWTIMTVSGFMKPPEDLFLVYQGLFLLAWFSAGFAMMMSVLAEMHSVIEKVSHPLTYLSIIISGCFFMVEWLPPELRPLALYNPTVHCFEMIRGGYFGGAVTVHYDVSFVAAVSLVLTLIGLAAVRGMRKWVPVE